MVISLSLPTFTGFALMIWVSMLQEKKLSLYYKKKKKIVTFIIVHFLFQYLGGTHYVTFFNFLQKSK